ncbi:collagen alpha-4(IV) chain-like [Cyanistes caeruleus]|uniref:collagen alpha-4(IV) chain-like n=1 Tax=Cyanistes caeruleus TaxID=156563 RepID=UPI000CDA562E|nr:collagen alpha-4(IV) chain-like [Cyanistes caeruleus]XP_023779932.1 collagen alpha-4(IV) chain-like [Cyanistes caeruleus]
MRLGKGRGERGSFPTAPRFPAGIFGDPLSHTPHTAREIPGLADPPGSPRIPPDPSGSRSVGIAHLLLWGRRCRSSGIAAGDGNENPGGGSGDPLWDPLGDPGIRSGICSGIRDLLWDPLRDPPREPGISSGVWRSAQGSTRGPRDLLRDPGIRSGIWGSSRGSAQGSGDLLKDPPGDPGICSGIRGSATGSAPGPGMSGSSASSSSLFFCRFLKRALRDPNIPGILPGILSGILPGIHPEGKLGGTSGIFHGKIFFGNFFFPPAGYPGFSAFLGGGTAGYPTRKIPGFPGKSQKDSGPWKSWRLGLASGCREFPPGAPPRFPNPSRFHSRDVPGTFPHPPGLPRSRHSLDIPIPVIRIALGIPGMPQGIPNIPNSLLRENSGRSRVIPGARNSRIPELSTSPQPGSSSRFSQLPGILGSGSRSHSRGFSRGWDRIPAGSRGIQPNSGTPSPSAGLRECGSQGIPWKTPESGPKKIPPGKNPGISRREKWEAPGRSLGWGWDGSGGKEELQEKRDTGGKRDTGKTGYRWKTG